MCADRRTVKTSTGLCKPDHQVTWITTSVIKLTYIHMSRGGCQWLCLSYFLDLGCCPSPPILLLAPCCLQVDFLSCQSSRWCLSHFLAPSSGLSARFYSCPLHFLHTGTLGPSNVSACSGPTAVVSSLPGAQRLAQSWGLHIVCCPGLDL